MKNFNMTLLGFAALVLVPAMASAADKANDEKAKTGAGAKPAAKPLCDDQWEGGFWTVAIDEKKFDGNASNLKDYDPNHPDDPWQVLSDRYFGLRDCCGNVYLNRFLGRFGDREQAEVFLRKVYANSAFARHLNPRFPPAVTRPDALLVSNHYACKLDRQNDNLRKAEWIVEVDGHLFAGAESACKQGKKKKTVAIVACDGKKVLATDTWAAPCDGSRVDTCLFPMSTGVVGIRQEYSASGEGRQTSFRAYELDRGKVLVKLTGGGDWGGGGGSFRDFQDRDGDGVPEVIDRECDAAQECKEARIRKWRNNRFEDVKVE